MEKTTIGESIYRNEAVKHSLNLSEGTVLTWNRSHRFALIAISVTLVLLLYYFFSVSHRLSAKAFGEVSISGTQFIAYAPSSGVIELSLSKGETIDAGHKLFKVARRDISDEGYIDNNVSAEQKRQKNILEQTISLLESQLSNLKLTKAAKIKSIEAAIETGKKILEKEGTYLQLLDTDMVNVANLNREGFAGYKEMSDIKKKVLSKGIQVEESRSSLNSLTEEKAQIDLDFEAHEFVIAEKLLDTRLRLFTLNERVSLSKKTTDQWVTTDIPGKVSIIFVSNAQHVSMGEPVLKIISGNAPFIIEAFLDSKNMEGVRIGKEVAINFHSFPSLKHGLFYGRVSKVPDDVIPDSKLPNYLRDRNNYYKIQIDTNDESLKDIRGELKIGMTADIEILGKERTMYEWVVQRLINPR